MAKMRAPPPDSGLCDTPDLAYSDTRFSKKLDLPCSEMSSIHVKGLLAWYTLASPSSTCAKSGECARTMRTQNRTHQQTVCHELNVLAHERGVHANQRDREGVAHKLLLNGHSIANDGRRDGGLGLAHQLGEKQARKIAVQPWQRERRLSLRQEWLRHTTHLRHAR